MYENLNNLTNSKTLTDNKNSGGSENALSQKRPNTDSGTFSARVSGADNALPIKGALVLVSREVDEKNELFGVLHTDENGATPVLTLPAPQASDSLNPDIDMPYEIYYVKASHPGYYTEADRFAQIYGNSHSYMEINMLPLPEYPDKDVIFY